MRKKIYTHKDLFNLTVESLKRKNLLPDILDYYIADTGIWNIRTCSWDCIGYLKFGGSEGIYLDMYLVGDLGLGCENERIKIGTFKTLVTSKEAFHTMATLMADFILELREFVNIHIDEFD